MDFNERVHLLQNHYSVDVFFKWGVQKRNGQKYLSILPLKNKVLRYQSMNIEDICNEHFDKECDTISDEMYYDNLNNNSEDYDKDYEYSGC